jgi:uncharacterized coiled-coil protein SlyX
MAEETTSGQRTTRRRGRPPGSVNKISGGRRKRAVGSELVEQLNDAIADLIKENRKLKRQLVKLTERGSSAASNTVERGLRTIQRRVQRALGAAPKRRRGATTAAATSRRKAVTRRRRKPSG